MLSLADVRRVPPGEGRQREDQGAAPDIYIYIYILLFLYTYNITYYNIISYYPMLHAIIVLSYNIL